MHGVGALPSRGYGQGMRIALILAFLFLAACSKEQDAPAGNEQAVIDKANNDVMAAQAESKPAP